MKYFTATLFILFANICVVQAQSGTGRISGIIKDTVTGTVLESATVIIYKPDSTVVLFKITDKNGQYDISGLPMNAKYFLSATYTGYKDYRQPFTMDKLVKKMDTIFLQLKSSNEVVVTAIVPIRMNGDTLEINPAAFKMTNDAVAEDLLNKVPGIVVWADGTITMNGKPVPKILVDGKPFLGSKDHRIATQNLPKNVIDKIQVYNEVDMTSETNRSRITDPQAPKDSLLTMDIKLKADKKGGFFGKYGAGAGTGSRYQTDLTLQLYNKRSSVAIGGGANNINAEIANLEDVQRENSFRNNYATYRNRSNFNRRGINSIVAPGILYTHSFSETDNERTANRISSEYNYNNNAGNVTNQTYQERYLKEGDQLINSQSNNNSTSQQHDVQLNYNKSLSYSKRFSINAIGKNGTSVSDNTSGADIKSRQGASISNRISNAQSRADTKSFTTNINYANYDSENPLKAIDANITFSRTENVTNRNESSLYNFYTTAGINNTTIKRRYNKETDGTNFTGSLNYNGLKRLLLGRFNLFGIDISTRHIINFQEDNEVNNVFDIDVNQKENNNRYLTYNEVSSTLQYVPSLSLSKKFSKWSSKKYSYYSIRTTVNNQFIQESNISSRINRNINRSFSFLRVNAGANYSYQKTNVYRLNGGLNYENGYGYPSINQIAPVIDSINLYALYKGGLNLVNTKSHNFNGNISYSTTSPKKPTQFSVNLNASFNNVLNAYVDSTINLRDTATNVSGQDSIYLTGRQLRYTINGNRRYGSNIGYNASLSRKIKDNQLQLQYNGNVNLGMMPSFIDNIYTIINTTNFTQVLRLNYYYKTIVITGIGTNLNFNNSRQTGYKNNTFNTRTITGEFNVTVNISKNASISSNLSYSKNNGILKAITIWNANAGYRFLKSKQAEVKFTATDILKQFRNITYLANPDGVTSSVSNGLQQYFMITLSYFPRKFGGGNTNKRTVQASTNTGGSNRVIIR